MKSSWTGVMCFSLDHVPLVGRLPQGFLDRPAGGDDSAEWISAGYGGYGMVNAFLSAKVTAKMILGQNVRGWLPDEYVSTPTRAGKLRQKLRALEASEPDHLRALL
jgi:glycine/D-amino acid oxidase-like deaminating enzyme